MIEIICLFKLHISLHPRTFLTKVQIVKRPLVASRPHPVVHWHNLWCLWPAQDRTKRVNPFVGLYVDRQVCVQSISDVFPMGGRENNHAGNHPV